MAKPFVIIKLDKPRKLRYTINAMVTLEDLTGKPFASFVNGLGNEENFSFKDLRALVWAGLIDEDPSLTPEDVGNLLDKTQDLTEVLMKVGEALQTALGGQKKSNQGPERDREGSRDVDWDWDDVQRIAFGLLGLKPWEFGNMTIAEFNLMLEGYEQRITFETQQTRYHAWLVANLVRAKKIPKLKTLLDIKKPAEDKPIEVRRQEHQELVERYLKARKGTLNG